MKQNAWEWNEQDLQDLIKLGVQEGLELDYKQSDALQKSDPKKNELSKDVSAFANSAGGVLVYGMKENGHVPTAIDAGLDPNEISKEWIEQVINSRIQRRLDGVRVNQVALQQTSPGRVAYVVSVPASNRSPHQAADKRFYKRFNFESVPMEEYEIRDIANRSSAPDLDIEFSFSPGGNETLLDNGDDQYFSQIGLIAVISNSANTVAEYAVISLFIDDRIALGKPGSDVRMNPETESIEIEGHKVTLRKLTTLWDRSKGLPIFSGISANLPLLPLLISLPKGPEIFALRYIIGSPGMTTKDKWVMLTVNDGLARFIRANTKLDAKYTKLDQTTNPPASTQ
jgi:hypothetical protein